MRTSIFSFEKEKYVLYPIKDAKKIKKQIINTIRARPKYFVAKSLLSFVSNPITPFLAKVKLQTGAVYQQS